MFKKAVLSNALLRMAIMGPSGSGKTYTSLKIATTLGLKVAVIDTEYGSSQKLADKFNFDMVELTDHSVSGYIGAINAAKAAGYDVLIIDSLSHEWNTLNDTMQKLAEAKYKDNTFRAWAEGTPLHKQLINAILSYPGHILATMRVKTEYAVNATTNSNGQTKTSISRVGGKPEQGKGIEYEFDVLMNMTPDHLGHVLKDRSELFQDKIIDKPGTDMALEFKKWLSGDTTNVKQSISNEQGTTTSEAGQDNTGNEPVESTTKQSEQEQTKTEPATGRRKRRTTEQIKAALVEREALIKKELAEKESMDLSSDSLQVEETIKKAEEINKAAGEFSEESKNKAVNDVSKKTLCLAFIKKLEDIPSNKDSEAITPLVNLWKDDKEGIAVNEEKLGQFHFSTLAEIKEAMKANYNNDKPLQDGIDYAKYREETN